MLASSLRGYRRDWLPADAGAALTLLVIVIPEQLATSRLAGMPPVTGFYAFVAGSVLFALFGSNPRMSVGADSTIAPLFAVGVGHLAATGSTRYVDLVGILAVMVGIIVALVGILRLGWIAEFMSAPIISGFLAGVAVIIVVHQLPDLLGIPGGSGNTVHRIHSVISHLSSVNGWSLGIGVGVMAVVVAAERISRRLPGALVAMVASVVLVSALGLRGHAVAVLGTFPHGAPLWGLGGVSWAALRNVAPVAAVVSLVVVSQSAATTRAFADDTGRSLDVSRDFLGVGAGSVVAGLAGSFPVNASPPRTAALAAAGARTQAAGLGAAVVVVATVPLAGLLRDLPVATLAAVLMLVAARIFHVRQLVSIARFDPFEMGLAVVTLMTVALIGVQQGIGVAVGLAILDRTRLSAQPQLHVLGRIPGTTSWAPVGSEGASPVPGVLVVLFATPLWYANADHFRAQFERALTGTTGGVHAVVLDAIGMSDIDYTGSRALDLILDELDRRHIPLAVARAGERVRHSLERSGLLARVGPANLFPSVDEAVTAVAAVR